MYTHDTLGCRELTHPTTFNASFIHTRQCLSSLTTLCPVLQARFGTPNAARFVVSHSFEQIIDEPGQRGRAK